MNLDQAADAISKTPTFLALKAAEVEIDVFMCKGLRHNRGPFWIDRLMVNLRKGERHAEATIEIDALVPLSMMPDQIEPHLVAALEALNTAEPGPIYGKPDGSYRDA